MGVVTKLADAFLFVFFLLTAVLAPLFDAQSCLPETFFPKSLVDLKDWYSVEYGDYMVAEKPGFYVGVIWLELLFQWPLSLLNLYAVVTGATWFPTTCLIYGASVLSSMAAIIGELVTSGRASETLLMVYYPFLGLAVLAILRGLLSRSSARSTPTSAKGLASRKKRA
ncbi:Sigma intracellular receptor 2 [Vitis vinifera]|uniref:Sigma intracellular receptor 2 n=1 Tax=Vitis vinifera TaxID=29760 RepID=A0A438JHT4_VITVI|nr:Sigma intracellular receptor 2 [Vitis vinifera]